MRRHRALQCVATLAALAPLTAAPMLQAAEDDAGLEEIIVTAQFREAKLQETPIAITAMTEEAMASRGLTDIVGISSYVPNVNLAVGASGNGKSTEARIRGIGEWDFNLAIEPAVGFYVDDVYHATVFGSVFDLLDLDRVEVLRGPQGTLFGKNSAGGAVRLISKKPAGDNSGVIEGTYGSFHRLDVRGAMDVSVVPEKLLLRVSFGTKSREGYVDVLDFACVNPTLAGDGTAPLSSTFRRQFGGTNKNPCKVGEMGNENVQAGRLALRYLASQSIEVNVTADYLNDDSQAPGTDVISIANPATNSTLNTFNNNVAIPLYGVPYDSRFLTASHYETYSTFDNPRTGKSYPNISEVEHWGVSGVLDWTVSPALQLKSITAYRSLNGRFAKDPDGSPIAADNNTYDEIYHHQFSQELRLSGQVLRDRLDWTVGAFYFDGYSRDQGNVDIVAGNFQFDIKDPATVTNASAFVHGVYRASDKMSLTAAVRYTDEKKDYTFYRLRQPAGVPFFLLPDGTRTTTVPRDVAYDKFDWKIGADYRWTSDIMTYVQVATGFRSGGFNPRPLDVATVTVFYPENLVSYEIGAKTELFDRRLRFNAAAFYSDYSDIQLSASGADLNGNPRPIRTNAATAELTGFEVEAQFRPVEGLLLEGSIGHVDFRYRDLGNASAAAIAAAGGNPASAPCLDCVPVSTPSWTASAGGQYTFALGERAGGLTVRGDYMYRSRVFYTVNNIPEASEPAFGVINGRITWDAPGDEWSAALLVTNIADERYYYNRFSSLSNLMVYGTPGRPREWAVSVKRRF